jgi:glycosyltransferase involved in cell wall biosynthesis
LTSSWVDVWISNSYAGKEISIKREKFPADKIEVIHNGIDLSKYKRIPDDDIGRLKKHYGIKDNDMVIGEVANLRSMKGHVDIINAIPTLIEKHKNVKFFFAGEDASNGEIARYAEEKNVDKYIIFAGFCNNIPEILSLFDIFILPSLWEGLPTAIIEAMAMGLPIISTKVGGIPELIDNAKNGILIEPKSPQQIASAILYLLENKDLAKSMGERNIARAWQNHDIKQKARDDEKIYMELMKK